MNLNKVNQQLDAIIFKLLNINISDINNCNETDKKNNAMFILNKLQYLQNIIETKSKDLNSMLSNTENTTETNKINHTNSATSSSK